MIHQMFLHPNQKLRTFCSSVESVSKPYAIAAAVGSLIILKTFNPAIVPASFVACRCASLKYAGTVMTAEVTVFPEIIFSNLFHFC